MRFGSIRGFRFNDYHVSPTPTPHDKPCEPNPQQQHRGRFRHGRSGVQELVGGEGGVGDSDFVDESLEGAVVVVGVAADGEAGGEAGVEGGEGADGGEHSVDEEAVEVEGHAAGVVIEDTGDVGPLVEAGGRGDYAGAVGGLVVDGEAHVAVPDIQVVGVEAAP